MAIKTTTIGAYPKPDFLSLSDWFDGGGDGLDKPDPTALYTDEMERMGDDAEALFVRAAEQVIADQVEAGVDIPTDGEVRRENYVHYHCRHLDGIDFENLTDKVLRDGAYQARLPTITGPVSARDNFLPHDWTTAQALTDNPVKVTLPGPMTIGNTVADDHYGDRKKRGADLAKALNVEILALAEAGCVHIQVDEPLFARRVDDALAFGFDNLEQCFEGVPDSVVRTVHMCCGYPDHLDNPDYPKAPKDCYFDLAKAIDASSIQAVSVEDAHRNNDLSLLEMFQNTTVIFGVIAIAKSRLETIDEIRARLENALQHIDAERLIAAPDCGLGLFDRDQARAKLRNLCEAAHSV
jgi:5-methyltetrahydropteroyltriglutamate--homocysteine methyltransferase